MIVNDIIDEARKIFGECSLASLLDHINDAVELIAFKGDIDPLIGFADLCCSGRCVTLPRNVETPLSVNIDGHPSLARDMLFRFHYNGLGDCGCSPCKWEWDDHGLVAVFRDLFCPSKIVATIEKSSDENAEVWIFGIDKEGRTLRTQLPDGSYRDGHQLPTVFGYSMPAPDAPCVARIDRIWKAVTNGTVQIKSLDASTGTPTVLAILDWDEQDPQYRRIRLSRDATVVRIAYRKRIIQLRGLYDAVPIHSRLALKMAMLSIKFYKEQDFPNGQAFEVTAARLLEERQAVIGPPTSMPIQINDEIAIYDRCDEID
jgi:hypothetical protein